MSQLQPVFIREEILKSIREFFYKQNFHEVITPTFNRGIPVEPNIYSFKTIWNTRPGEIDLHMSTSPEQGLKKMLAKGVGNCFAFGKCFRNLEGSGSKHMPEYMMLEWYREDAYFQDIMKDTQEVILHVQDHINEYLGRPKTRELTYQGQTISLEGKWSVFKMGDLFKKYANLDLEEIMTDEGLFKKAAEKGYSVENSKWSEAFDQIFVQEIEQNMPLTPYFIVDFPARLSPLCVVQKDKPYLADRTEFFMFGMELANMNNENLDYRSIKNNFEKEQQERKDRGLQTPPIDEDFINAIKTLSETGKHYAGIGFGIDRLAMIMADVPRVQDVEILHV